ncbi:glutamate dehydrogenase (NADP+) [Tindallia magadiensis]|uniref:Glutamate dehydrogenase n=1 Tax=Tindallia magadiensis TaxID=69895 RepID=A0A1I3BX61_9FIRM|nr:NADP-specific glutamate dehydrogenase [Tindallia magadiensis]SFH66938.1 glutamate dehydrogenase (NADP+) [Tindallia magadiensis]
MSMHDFMNEVAASNPDQPEFLQAVKEVVESVWPVYQSKDSFRENKVLSRLVEPERQVIFRVTWVDDDGEVQVNRGYRIQFNSAIGPYKGGMRFHPTVNLSILKFLGFEQIFKNSLTTLPMGGGKGGSDFDPKGKSDGEVMRFCQNLMLEMYRHIGPDTDVPAGDIGVGKREIGYMFGTYCKIRNDFTGVYTGKGREWGGSLLRPQATGFGCVYFAEDMLNYRGDSLEGKTVLVSGSGNVAQYAIQKVNEMGGKVVTISDSSGYIYDPEGVKGEKWDYLLELKNQRRGRVKEYADTFGVEFHAGKRPWSVPGEVAFPCATQNEISGEEARTLVKNGCICVSEGANMPAMPEAVEVFQKEKVLFAPGKAANAGGVSTSGLEMSQNSLRISWTAEEIDQKLRGIMKAIHEQCVEHGKKGKEVDYVKGANVAGFLKVANAMVDRGVL